LLLTTPPTTPSVWLDTGWRGRGALAFEFSIMPRTAKHWDSKRYDIYHNQFMKTQLCKYYAVGGCTKGEECNFAHGQEQLSGMPNLKKTALCEDFKRGTCPHDKEHCQYAHGQDDLRSSLAFEPLRKAAQAAESVQARAKPASTLSKGGGSSPKKAKAAKTKKLPKEFSDGSESTVSTCSSRRDTVQALQEEVLHTALQQLQRINLQASEEMRKRAYLQQLVHHNEMSRSSLSAQGGYPPMYHQSSLIDHRFAAFSERALCPDQVRPAAPYSDMAAAKVLPQLDLMEALRANELLRVFAPSQEEVALSEMKLQRAGLLRL